MVLENCVIMSYRPSQFHPKHHQIVVPQALCALVSRVGDQTLKRALSAPLGKAAKRQGIAGCPNGAILKPTARYLNWLNLRGSSTAPIQGRDRTFRSSWLSDRSRAGHRGHIARAMTVVLVEHGTMAEIRYPENHVFWTILHELQKLP